MRRKYIISTLAFLSTLFCYSQFKDYNNTIGFVCGGAGESTPIVSRAYDKLESKSYGEIISMLYSENPAENFLGVVLCEELNGKGIIKLTEKDSKKIVKLYKSNRTVEVCGGCTFTGFVKLSLLLKNKDADKTRQDADRWLKDSFIE
jgi:hypothetical protein